MEIVIPDSGYKSYDFEKELFAQIGFSLKIHPTYQGDKAEKKNFANNADGILVRHTINTSRGEVIDGKALLEALNSGKIHSAGPDVFDNEPVTANQDALVNHPGTFCTSHYA
jgi:phosphoglycerate dehydrogenase-like enzyme